MFSTGFSLGKYLILPRGRQCEEERAAFAGFGLHPDLTTVTLHHLLADASPMPVPEYSVLPYNRCKITKVRSAYCGSMPMPLSLVEKSHLLSWRSALRWIRGGCSA